MPKTKELVLLYNFDSDRAKAIKLVLFKLGIRFKVIPSNDYHHPLGYLIGLKDFTPSATPEIQLQFNDEMLVLFQFSSNRIDQLLLEFKKSKIEKIALKAIVTPNNVYWSSHELCEELKKEHAQMNQQSPN